MPEWMMPNTFRTPEGPPAARPHSTGRPIMTARAPRASALTTSPPRRTPPSSRTSAWPPTAATTPGSALIEAGVPSTVLPPRGEPAGRGPGRAFQAQPSSYRGAAPVPAAGKRPVERDDQRRRTAGLGQLRPLKQRVAAGGPVHLEEQLRVGRRHRGGRPAREL